MRKVKQAEHPMALRLGYILKRAQHALRTGMDEQLSPFGLTAPQYNVLSAVQLVPGISNASLARAAFVTAQSMQGIVANLEKVGFLSRDSHPTHGRIRRSKLTRKGVEALSLAHQAVNGVEARMTAGLSGQELEALRSMLERCVENMMPISALSLSAE